ncbi:RDD family protein [Dermabacteraceae bacterium TAE3-ERU27]|nr:RDD family protein [Dermabacteraceae bacterium TAE3-ERU27]
MSLPSFSPNSQPGSQGDGYQPPTQAPYYQQQPQPQQPTAPAVAEAVKVVEYVDIPGREPVKLASVTQRFLARVIDLGIFLAVDALIIFMLTGVLSLGSGDDASDFIFTFLGLMVIFNLYLMPLMFLFGYLYESIMVTLWGATVGKLLFGVKVVNSVNAELPGPGAGFMRFLIPALCPLIPFIGLLGTLIFLISPTFDSSGRRQGWHDKIANTLVVASK